LGALWILVAREAPIFAEVHLWTRVGRDGIEDHLPMRLTVLQSFLKQPEPPVERGGVLTALGHLVNLGD
jgi:hypothetical protein